MMQYVVISLWNFGIRLDFRYKVSVRDGIDFVSGLRKISRIFASSFSSREESLNWLVWGLGNLLSAKPTRPASGYPEKIVGRLVLVCEPQECALRNTNDSLANLSIFGVVFL